MAIGDYMQAIADRAMPSKTTPTLETPYVQAAPPIGNEKAVKIGEGVDKVAEIAKDAYDGFTGTIVTLKNVLVYLVKNWQITVIGAFALFLLLKRI